MTGCCAAEEKGLPFLGMMPYIMSKYWDLSELHDKHGPHFRINTGPIAGWTLSVNEVQDMADVLSADRPFDASWPGALPTHCLNDCPVRKLPPALMQQW
jgi:hypothetical protein